MPSNSELNDILGKVRWGDLQREDGTWGRGISNEPEITALLLAWRNREVEEADRKTLETISSLLNGDYNQVEVGQNYIRNKLKMYAGRAAHQPGGKSDDQ